MNGSHQISKGNISSDRGYKYGSAYLETGVSSGELSVLSVNGTDNSPTILADSSISAITRADSTTNYLIGCSFQPSMSSVDDDATWEERSSEMAEQLNGSQNSYSVSAPSKEKFHHAQEECNRQGFQFQREDNTTFHHRLVDNTAARLHQRESGEGTHIIEGSTKQTHCYNSGHPPNVNTQVLVSSLPTEKFRDSRNFYTSGKEEPYQKSGYTMGSPIFPLVTTAADVRNVTTPSTGGSRKSSNSVHRSEGKGKNLEENKGSLFSRISSGIVGEDDRKWGNKMGGNDRSSENNKEAESDNASNNENGLKGPSELCVATDFNTKNKNFLIPSENLAEDQAQGCGGTNCSRETTQTHPGEKIQIYDYDSTGGGGYKAHKTPTRSDQWRDAKDPQTGRVYYYNRRTRQTRWSLPPGAVFLPRKKIHQNRISKSSDKKKEEIDLGKGEKSVSLPSIDNSSQREVEVQHIAKSERNISKIETEKASFAPLADNSKFAINDRTETWSKVKSSSYIPTSGENTISRHKLTPQNAEHEKLGNVRSQSPPDSENEDQEDFWDETASQSELHVRAGSSKIVQQRADKNFQSEESKGLSSPLVLFSSNNYTVSPEKLKTDKKAPSIRNNYVHHLQDRPEIEKNENDWVSKSEQKYHIAPKTFPDSFSRQEDHNQDINKSSPIVEKATPPAVFCPYCGLNCVPIQALSHHLRSCLSFTLLLTEWHEEHIALEEVE